MDVKTTQTKNLATIQKLIGLIRGWDAVWQTIDVLRTRADWYVTQKACKKALMQVCIKGVPRLPIEDGVLAHSTSWTIRDVLLLKMHLEKVWQLKAGALMPGSSST